ncbi:hypothetical protein F5X71_34525 [Nocardia brasiliensis]|uniref:Uncharacterized protein n=1 Tax=Nocardia brasiliensis TaxID=37326 RepID=A0A6G9Y105_NOCBR|nr:hypothetical protein [Nocardia brasiliensis]QIS06743.1 hypothetical protein F5X71_34525 [Nocardia brasiliensis]
MPDEYDKIREDFNPPERGRIFESGTNEVLGDREQGHVRHPDPRPTSLGPRHYDKERADDHGKIHALEEKSGQTGSANDLRELKKDRELLAAREIETLTIRTVVGEKMSPKYVRELSKLRDEFKNRVIHIELTRDQARVAFGKGISLEKPSPQLELPGVADVAREQVAVDLQKRKGKIATLAQARETAERFRAVQKFSQGAERGRKDAERAREVRETRENEQARDRELAKTAETREQIKVKNVELAQAMEDQARDINSAWDSGEAVPVEKVRDAHATLSRDLAEIREAELVQARDDFVASGHTSEEVRTIESRLEQVREEARREIVKGIDTLGVIVERGDNAHTERETAEQQRERERAAEREAARAQDAARQAAYERLDRQGQLTEAERLHWLGQGTDPRAAVRSPPAPAPSVERGGTGQGQGINRSLNPTREGR